MLVICVCIVFVWSLTLFFILPLFDQNTYIFFEANTYVCEFYSSFVYVNISMTILCTPLQKYQ